MTSVELKKKLNENVTQQLLTLNNNKKKTKSIELTLIKAKKLLWKIVNLLQSMSYSLLQKCIKKRLKLASLSKLLKPKLKWYPRNLGYMQQKLMSLNMCRREKLKKNKSGVSNPNNNHNKSNKLTIKR